MARVQGQRRGPPVFTEGQSAQRKDPITLFAANNEGVLYQCLHLPPAWPVNQWLDNVNCVSHLPNKTSAMDVAGILHRLRRLFSCVLPVRYR